MNCALVDAVERSLARQQPEIETVLVKFANCAARSVEQEARFEELRDGTQRILDDAARRLRRSAQHLTNAKRILRQAPVSRLPRA